MQIKLIQPNFGLALPQSNDNKVIRDASCCGYAGIVKLLLADSRVDPTAMNNEAIRSAYCWGDTEIAKLLLADSRVVSLMERSK